MTHAIPKVVPLPTEKVMQAIKVWVENHADDDMRPDDIIRVYSPSEWAKRGERHGNDASMIFLVQGVLQDILNFECRDDLYEDFQDLLEAHGYMNELGFSWSVYLYPSDA